MSKHSPPPDTGTRLHALDNLRALLMWLGIVLHVEAIYAIQRMPNAWRDDQRTLFADVVVSSIHAFRMPAFFILGGFFAALLVRSRGPDGLLRHRLMRLGLPFALFWPLLWLASGVAALFFMNLMVHDEWGLDTQVVPRLPILDSPNTIHLWFLWMLLWFCVATAALWRLPRAWFAPVESALAWLARQPWGFVVLALPLAVASAAYPNAILAPAGAFLPEWNEWLYHGSFFVFGLMLHGRQAELFARFQRHWAGYAVAGLACYLMATAVTLSQGPVLLSAYSYHCISWLWSFAAIGLALRLVPSRHAVLGYLSDSAYWVYLLHYPLTILFGALLFEQPLPALAKMAINIAGTTLVCLGSYELFVRHGWISQLLNGKRHPRRSRGGGAEHRVT
ncbi:acyltransferase family protein [uncultured Hydrogenophaga sp.]|uniref:acyltransferase family protein n=1 Tax=uncultured Hydrogenophaga sp. TaxID=199683 RepID=UPI0025865E01|nr:acyltransferase family protein [uncultured Hydrogenophaga sp.]